MNTKLTVTEALDSLNKEAVFNGLYCSDCCCENDKSKCYTKECPQYKGKTKEYTLLQELIDNQFTQEELDWMIFKTFGKDIKRGYCSRWNADKINEIKGSLAMKITMQEEILENEYDVSHLQRCPHCGKQEVLEIVCDDETEDCSYFYSIVCNLNKGGCGASGGYRDSKKEAIETWNKRFSNK